MDRNLDTNLDANLESNLESNLETEKPAHQLRYLTAHSTCAMCETKLEIRHEINKNELKLKEEAHCPSCGIRVRSAHHLLH